jgi:serine/threonine protein kinase
MDYSSKWEIIRKIGGGGQGIVYQVVDKSIKKETDNSIADFFNSIKVAHIDDIRKRLDEFFSLSYKRLSIHEESNHKALKVLHKPSEARDTKLAKVRIKNELKAMHDIQNPNLLKVVEYDTDANWFVSDYYRNETLEKKLNFTIGRSLYSLKLVRPLIEAVSELHKNKIIHRDIKPENIFIDSNNELVLGDFGLVFFNDIQHTRISNTFSNVGSRDWMPGWAMGKRIEEVNPSFDIFFHLVKLFGQ